MKILGLTSHVYKIHDNSIALLHDGKVVFAEAEERISRVKHDGRFPYLAIREALKVAGIKLSDIDYFVSAYPEENILWMFLTSLRFIPVVGFGKYISHIVNRFRFKIDEITEGKRPKSYMEAGFPKDKLIKVSHYLAHAAAAYYSGPFDKCLVIAVDGFGPGKKGEPLSGSVYRAKNSKFDEVEKVPVWGSLGLYYGAVTKALGFKLNDGEGKTMGLAAYGDPVICYKQMKEFFPNFVKGKWTIRNSIMDILNIQRIKVFDESLTLRKLKSYIDIYGKENVAAACQLVFEEELLKYVKYLIKKHKEKKLVLVGGIFLNVKANMRIYYEITKDLFVYPNPADGGTAMGAAMIGFLKKKGKFKRKELLHSAFGREFSNKEISSVLTKTKGIEYKEVKRGLAKRVAKLLVKGNVIGWFQGKDEWGPRALGQRSVIADPRKVTTKDRINDILKGREWFMPFAPSILEERAENYLKSLRKAPFMILADDVKEGKVREIQAAIHIDKTARPQIVTEKVNPLYYKLIEEFEKLTKVGVILNTSFNKHGLPIVYSPKDAVEHLLWEAIDILVIGNYVVKRASKK